MTGLLDTSSFSSASSIFLTNRAFLAFSGLKFVDLLRYLFKHWFLEMVSNMFSQTAPSFFLKWRGSSLIDPESPEPLDDDKLSSPFLGLALLETPRLRLLLLIKSCLF